MRSSLAIDPSAAAFRETEPVDASSVQEVIRRRNNTPQFLPQLTDTETRKTLAPLEARSASASGPFVSISASEVLAEWNGRVDDPSVNGLFFSATLTGVRGVGVVGSVEQALIPHEEVMDRDLDKVKPGNYFRLSVIRSVDQWSQTIRGTRVVFRDLPAYRLEVLEQAEAEARDLARRLGVDE